MDWFVVFEFSVLWAIFSHPPCSKKSVLSTAYDSTYCTTILSPISLSKASNQYCTPENDIQTLMCYGYTNSAGSPLIWLLRWTKSWISISAPDRVNHSTLRDQMLLLSNDQTRWQTEWQTHQDDQQPRVQQQTWNDNRAEAQVNRVSLVGEQHPLHRHPVLKGTCSITLAFPSSHEEFCICCGHCTWQFRGGNSDMLTKSDWSC